MAYAVSRPAVKLLLSAPVPALLILAAISHPAAAENTKSSRSVRVGAAQPRSRLIDWRLAPPSAVLDQLDQALGELERIAQAAGAAGCDALAFPEDTLGLGHWEAANKASLKDVLPEAVQRMLERLGRAAEKHRMYLVCCSDTIEADGSVRNTAFFLGRDGKEIGRYHKVNMPIHELDKKRGDRFPVFPTPDLGGVGLLICYDMVFPEAPRCLALGGADVIFYPTLGGAAIGDDDISRAAFRTRAVENFVYLVVAQRGGGAMIISPQGKIIAEGRGPDDIAIAEFDPFGGYFAAHEPWKHLMSTEPNRFQGFPFTTAEDLNWTSYICLEDSDAPGAKHIQQYGLDAVPLQVMMGEDYYEQDYGGPPSSKADPRFYYRWAMWSWILSGGSCNYGGRYGAIHPYSQTSRADLRWTGPGGMNFTGHPLAGLDSVPYIWPYFRDRNLDLGTFRPNDERASDLDGRTGQRRPKLMERGQDEFLVYHPNAAAEGKAARVDQTKTVRLRIDLTAAPGDFQVEWYRPHDGKAEVGGAVQGGAPRDLTAPWPGYDVLVRLARRAESPAARPGKAEGIAARYPGDAGIERDPHVLFAENFETGGLEELGKRWGEISNKEGKVMAFSGDVPPASGGRRSLEMTATLGENTGGHLYTRLPRGQEKVFARFYVKFAADAGYIHHFVTLGGYQPPTAWPQGGAGERPRGDDRFTAGIEPYGSYGRYAAPGAWNFYVYWHEMKGSADGKFWGNGLAPARPAMVPRDRWQCVEVMLRCNSALEKSDGELALWLDGQPAARFGPGAKRSRWTGMGFSLTEQGGEPFEGFRWRTSGDLKINFFWLLFYVTENAARQNQVANPNPLQKVWFDDIVVGTAYIGPLQK